MGCLRLKTGNSRFGTIKIETSSEKIIPPAIVIATDDCALVLKGSIAKGISEKIVVLFVKSKAFNFLLQLLIIVFSEKALSAIHFSYKIIELLMTVPKIIIIAIMVFTSAFFSKTVRKNKAPDMAGGRENNNSRGIRKDSN